MERDESKVSWRESKRELSQARDVTLQLICHPALELSKSGVCEMLLMQDRISLLNVSGQFRAVLNETRQSRSSDHCDKTAWLGGKVEKTRMLRTGEVVCGNCLQDELPWTSFKS